MFDFDGCKELRHTWNHVAIFTGLQKEEFISTGAFLSAAGLSEY